MRDIFQFKQFSVDQSGCAMKINTDAVLLGAIVAAEAPKAILDIGTGTGVIALMLAQKFGRALIDAVEIDTGAAQTAKNNFAGSAFADRMSIYPSRFEDFFDDYPQKRYALIVSNPPFYIDSLRSPGAKKALAKHADEGFFKRLISTVAVHLTTDGCFWLIVPSGLEEMIIKLALENDLCAHSKTYMQSFPGSEAHRVIINLGFNQVPVKAGKIIIYVAKGVYTQDYRDLLQPYFLAF